MAIDYVYIAELLNSIMGWHTRIYVDQALDGQYRLVDLSFDPVAPYLPYIFDVKESCFCIIAAEFTYYGIVRDEEARRSLIIGPVSDLHLGRAQCLRLLQTLRERREQLDAFEQYLDVIAPQRLEIFTRVLALISYGITGKKRGKVPALAVGALIAEPNNQLPPTTADSSQAEREPYHHTIEYEGQLLSFIQTGDLEGLRKFNAAGYVDGNIGKLANDTIRSRKNLFICMVTLVCRSAVRGGLDQELALTLSDQYIQRVEMLTNPAQIHAIGYEMMEDYCSKVASLCCPHVGTVLAGDVIRYVSQNLDTGVTVDDVAKQMGMNRSQLSRSFKRMTGKTIASLSREMRLASAKQLLATTSKPLSEISAQLAFSSQSHFHNSFKRMTGQTPLEYRNQAKMGQ